MGIVGFIILGLIVGAIIDAFQHRSGFGGLRSALFVGVVGAVFGGAVASAAGVGDVSSFFSPGAWIVAVVGALVFLMLVDRGRAHPNRVRGF